MTQDMHWKLCVDGDATQLIEGLDVSGMAYKRMDGTAPLYHCGKSIFGLNVQVEAPGPGHGKWWLDGKKGPTSATSSRACADRGKNSMLSVKWVERDRETIAVSPAD